MTAISWGWIIGIFVGIILVVVLLKVMNRDGGLRTQYDERQQIVRGKAYKVGFYAILLTNAILLFLSTGDFGIERLGYMVFFIPIFVGLVAQISYSIFKDGYVGLNTNMTRFIIIMAVIGAFNFFLAIEAQIHGELIQNGSFKGPFINLLCGMLFIIIAAELIVKKCIDSREE